MVVRKANVGKVRAQSLTDSRVHVSDVLPAAIEALEHCAQSLRRVVGELRLLLKAHEGEANALSARKGAFTSVFLRLGEYWQISYRDRTVVLRHRQGLAYLAILLDRPEQWLSVRDLEAGLCPDTSKYLIEDTREKGGSTPKVAHRRYDSRPVAGIGQLLERVRELRLALAEADAGADLTRVETIKAELRTIGAYVSEIKRERNPEWRELDRCRFRVRKSLTVALAVIQRHHPELAAHLRASIRFGFYCVYRPVGEQGIRWLTSV